MSNNAVIDEIDAMLEAISSGYPGIHTPAGKKLIKAFAAAMGVYFRKLSDTFPYGSLGGYVKNHTTSESVKEVADQDAIWFITDEFDPNDYQLEYIIRDYLQRGYLTGAQQAIDAIITAVAPDISLIDDGAMNWLNAHAAERVAQISDTTRTRLAQILTDGTNKGQGAREIASTIRRELKDMADAYKGRAYVIAQNEMHEAMSEASLRTYTRLGIEYKSWVRAGTSDFDCDICEPNEAQGPIPINDTFQSGHERPPAHPRCVCSLVPEYKKE